MTPEEQKIFDAMKAENEQLKQNQRKQNQYITQLEAQRGQAPQAQPPQTAHGETINIPAGQAKLYQNFIEEQMREKTMAKALAVIKAQVKPEVYSAIEPDFLAFLKDNLTMQNCTQDFIIDAFNLVYGRAIMKAEHPVNQLGKGSETPAATPAPTAPTVGTNAASVQAVQKVISSQPPVMSEKDKSAATGAPAPEGAPTVKSTKDAWANFKNRFSGNGG